MGAVSYSLPSRLTMPFKALKASSRVLDLHSGVLSLLTLLRTEGVTLAVGTLQRWRYMKCLPFLAIFSIWANYFATEQPSFLHHDHDSNGGITSTELKGRFISCPAFQRVNNALAAIDAFDDPLNTTLPAFTSYSRVEGVTSPGLTNLKAQPTISCSVTKRPESAVKDGSTKHGLITRRYRQPVNTEITWGRLARFLFFATFVTYSAAELIEEDTTVQPGKRAQEDRNKEARDDKQVVIILIVLAACLQSWYVNKILRTINCRAKYTSFHRTAAATLSILFFALIMSGDSMSHWEWFLLFEMTIFSKLNFTWDLYLSFAGSAEIRRQFIWTVSGLDLTVFLTLGFLKKFWDDSSNPKHPFKGFVAPAFILTNLLSFILYKYFNHKARQPPTASVEDPAGDSQTTTDYRLPPYRNTGQQVQDDGPTTASVAAVQRNTTSATPPDSVPQTGLGQSCDSRGLSSVDAGIERFANHPIEHGTMGTPVSHEETFRLTEDSSSDVDAGDLANSNRHE